VSEVVNKYTESAHTKFNWHCTLTGAAVA